MLITKLLEDFEKLDTVFGGSTGIPSHSPFLR